MSASVSAPASSKKKSKKWRFFALLLLAVTATTVVVLVNVYQPWNKKPLPDYEAELRNDAQEAAGLYLRKERDKISRQFAAGNAGYIDDPAVQARLAAVKKMNEFARSGLNGISMEDTRPAIADKGQTVNVEDFKVTCTDSNNCEVQHNAQLVWPETGIWLEQGDMAVFDSDPNSRVCAAASDPCAGPNGLYGPAHTSKVSPADFPIGRANYYSLIGKCGNETFPIGMHREYTASARCQIAIDDNARPQYKNEHTGGHKVRIIIRRNYS